MTTITAPEIRPETVGALTREELERELTLATLTSHREQTFNLLLAERRRRLEARFS